ncbi:hypothetical protein [Halalkalibacterium ligniniphilum]|uniref:hypothetical protein n=1 Tax=Halalkalibacterium ligniniphilum TaxID=1134413 RepID=UPI00034A9775|nr:hypothetical protein [Halalkalibacterium ligniniphilum]
MKHLVIIFSLFVLAGCFSALGSLNPNPLASGEDEVMTVLFSHPQSLSDENDYYDALLELQHAYPNQVPPVQVIDSNERHLVRHFDIDVFPTMLIIHEEDIFLKIQGKKSKEEIIHIFEQAFNLELDSTSFFLQLSNV